MSRFYYDADSDRLYGDRGVEIRRRMPPEAQRAQRVLNRIYALRRAGVPEGEATQQAAAEIDAEDASLERGLAETAAYFRIHGRLPTAADRRDR